MKGNERQVVGVVGVFVVGVSVDAGGKKIDDERDSGQLVRRCREDLFGLDGVRVRARDMDADDPELLRPGFEYRNNQ